MRPGGARDWAECDSALDGHAGTKEDGEEYWAQGEKFFGHRRASVSDLYALFDNANLGLALSATEDIIEEIEKKVPGAFTGTAPELKVINGGV